MMGNSFNLIFVCGALMIHNGGINPKAITPDPRMAAKERSDVFVTALTELRNNSGAADPNATNVTAIEREREQKSSIYPSKTLYLLGTQTCHFFRNLELHYEHFNCRHQVLIADDAERKEAHQEGHKIKDSKKYQAIIHHNDT